MYYGLTLADIERNYGCVAEYNRCMEEDEYEETHGYEPSYEELVENGECE